MFPITNKTFAAATVTYKSISNRTTW